MGCGNSMGFGGRMAYMIWDCLDGKYKTMGYMGMDGKLMGWDTNMDRMRWEWDMGIWERSGNGLWIYGKRMGMGYGYVGNEWEWDMGIWERSGNGIWVYGKGVGMGYGMNGGWEWDTLMGWDIHMEDCSM